MMFCIKLFRCTVLMDLLDRYDDNITQHITVSLIVMVGPYLATGMSSEEEADG